MNIKTALIWATKQLKQSASAELDAEVLLCFVIGKNKTWLFANPEDQLKPSMLQKFKRLVARRGRGEPIAYLTGTKEFYGYNFKITKNVLVPRPLTEELVNQALKFIQQNKKRPLTIADIGTGSGCIIISLAKELAKKESLAHFNFYATDVSGPALTVARANARTHGLNKKIKFRHGPLLKPLLNQQLDLILANLPYLAPADFTQEPSIQKEPRLALVGDFYPQLFQQAQHQIGAGQASRLQKSPLIIYEDLKGIQFKK